MSKLFTIAFLMIVCLSGHTPGNAQQPDAASIKKQMSDIRKSTNWEDPEAAKRANEKIKALSKQLMSTQNQGGTASSNPKPQNNSGEGNNDAANQKMEMWGQVMKSASHGRGADILLAEPVREQIKEDYKQDETSKVNSKYLQEEITVLCIDMSSPTVQLFIDQMENYLSIKTLVITGGKLGKPADLEMLLAKAKNYPLEQLYIINFKHFVNKIPKSVSNFSRLSFLALYNNNISILPPEISSLVTLKKLYVDMNPVASLTPTINKLKQLDTLGIAKTQVTSLEINKIQQQLPNCKLLLQ